jgi:hypothetical protein
MTQRERERNGRKGRWPSQPTLHPISPLSSPFSPPLPQRSVLIPEGSPAGYGARGLGEIPPNGAFELRVEVLDVAKAGGT